MLRIQWGDNIYQRRANIGLTEGELSAEEGTLRLERFLHRDQEFDWIRQEGDAIRWCTAATSNDRDGMLVHLSGVEGALFFRLQDPHLGSITIEIPFAELRRDGYYRWRGPGPQPFEHGNLKRMRIKAVFELECELVNPAAAMDFELEYEERPRPGDYYCLRMEQLDTNKGWASPVWIN